MGVKGTWQRKRNVSYQTYSDNFDRIYKRKKKPLTTKQIYANGEKLFDAVMREPNRIILEHIRRERKKKEGKK